MSQLRMFVERRKRRIYAGLGQLDSENEVVEPRMGRRFFSKNSAICMDQQIIGLYADLGQHGAEQSGFIFAVSVTMTENLSRSMRPIPSNTDLDSGITNITLRKTGQSLDARQ